MSEEFYFFGLALFVLIAGFGLMVFMHEQAHQTIFRYAGIKSDISFDLWGGHTTPLPDQNISMPLWASVGQVNNEAFGYQFQAGIILLALVMVVCSLYLGWKLDKVVMPCR